MKKKRNSENIIVTVDYNDQVSLIKAMNFNIILAIYIGASWFCLVQISIVASGSDSAQALSEQ